MMELKVLSPDIDKSDIIFNSQECQEILKIYDDYYPEIGFNMPWVGYFVVRDHQIVDCCGFTGKPQDGKVETLLLDI